MDVKLQRWSCAGGGWGWQLMHDLVNGASGVKDCVLLLLGGGQRLPRSWWILPDSQLSQVRGMVSGPASCLVQGVLQVGLRDVSQELIF